MKVGVVGCGVAGLAAALAMARKGHQVVILEAFETPRPRGSGLLLQPSGLAAMRVLTPLFQSRGPVGPWVRNNLFAPLAQAPLLDRVAAATLTGMFRLGSTPPELRP
ncbi:MAG: FAD-binding protein [Pseudomonadota bacterium]